MFNHRSIYSVIAFAAFLGTAITAPAHADEIWSINYSKSHFGPGTNTLVLERTSAQGAATKAASGTFLVISGRKVYMAVDEEALASPPEVRKVDFTQWRGMKLVQIGDNLRYDYCSLSCQSGANQNRVSLIFNAHGENPTDAMKSMIAVNTR